MIPTTLRLAVGPTRWSRMRCSSSSTIVSGAWWAARTAAIWSPARASRVAAGASGINTGKSVFSLTSSATWGRQVRAVAYHWPSIVVDRSPSFRVGGPIRSRSFFVARTRSTASSCRTGRHRSTSVTGVRPATDCWHFPCWTEVWCLSFGVYGVDCGLAGVVGSGAVVGAEVAVGQVDVAAAGAGDPVAARVVGHAGVGEPGRGAGEHAEFVADVDSVGHLTMSWLGRVSGVGWAVTLG